MKKFLNILHLEDNNLDADLVESHIMLNFPSAIIIRVTNKENFERMLQNQKFDLIVSDYQLLSFDGLKALELSKKYKPDLPFIFVSGSIDVETAIECLSNGAIDYLPKDHLKRIGFVINRALKEAEEKIKLKKSEEYISDININLQLKIEERTAELKKLSQRLLEIQEDERRIISQELHDELGQSLSAIKLNLQVLSHSYINEKTKKIIADTVEIVENSIENVRRISLDLRPSIIDDLGLISAIKWYIKRQEERTDISFGFNVLFENKRFRNELEIACFRITQESITNCIKHANAKNIIIELKIENGSLLLSIQDNGIGFDFKNKWSETRIGKSFGLLSMKERAHFSDGELRVESELGKGTIVKGKFRL